MDDLLYKIKNSPWSVPYVGSFFIHLLVILAMVFIVIPSGQDPNEHVTQSFHVKGVKDLPVIAGTPGGGQTRRFQNPRPSGKEARFTNASSVKDVSLQSLVNPSTSLKKVAVEVEPKQNILQEDSVLDSRDFQALLTETLQGQLGDKVQAKQRSTRSVASDKPTGKTRAPGQETILQMLQKPLEGMGLSGIPSLNIDPEEGMPGFTPMGAGGGGAGLAGSGSPGGFEDGMLGEPKENILKYGSLDNLLDIQVTTYQDPADQKKYFMIKIFANKNAKQFTVMPKEILFTIDCSLSISPDRLDSFKRGISECLKNLNKGDLFNVIAFKDKASFFAPKSVTATPETIKGAERFVSELSSNRTTDVYGAFEKIVNTPPARNPSNIILISDGRPTHGIVNSRELIGSVTRINNKVRPVFAYSGGVKVNRYLLDFISYQNRAWSQFIKDRGKISKGLVEFYAKIKDPIFLNLRYQLNGLDADDVYPRSLPDFYRNAEFTLYGTYEGQDQFSMQLLGDVDGQTKELVFTRSLADSSKGGPDIMKGYAFNKIYHLISQTTLKGQDSQLIRQIQELSKRYKVTTPYSPELAEID